MLTTLTKWVVLVPVAGLLGSAATALVLGGVDYGHLKSSLETEQDRVTQLISVNDEYRAAIDKWRDANSKLQSELATTKGRLTSIQNDQCDSIQRVIGSLDDDLSYADRYHYSDQKRVDINTQLALHQESLRACFASRK